MRGDFSKTLLGLPFSIFGGIKVQISVPEPGIKTNFCIKPDHCDMLY